MYQLFQEIKEKQIPGIDMEILSMGALRPENGGRRSPAIMVAMGGVALSLAVMMIAIAVTSGFKKEISDKIEGFEAQLRIVYPPENP